MFHEGCLIDSLQSVETHIENIRTLKMATSSKNLEISNDVNNVATAKKIAELKKKILLAEGQKRALAEEWEQKERKVNETIAELKKDIKELTSRLTYYNNVANGKRPKEAFEAIRRVPYPPGADTAEQALQIYDLKVIDLTKQSDLLNARYNKRKEYFDQLHARYEELLALKSDASTLAVPNKGANAIPNAPPQTVEEDLYRKRVYQLENEIHRTNVQLMEAEHVHKKYKSIKASLMADAERFEKNLLELEEALREQQADVNRMQEVHREAIQMRDATKVVLMQQEHQAHSSSKSRERQSLDFRRQVEERKMELERLERKLFTTSRAVVRQGSMDSLAGDAPLTEKANETASTAHSPSNITQKLEAQLKVLMTATGATSPQEVLQRFTAQKEASTRLNYLRTVTEGEKKHLETQRDELTADLESSRFTDVKESEVNQEHLEKLKTEINEQCRKEQEHLQAADHSKLVLNSIQSTIVDLILKLQEIDEIIDPMDMSGMALNPFVDLSCENVSNDFLLQLLENKLKRGLISTGQYGGDDDSGRETDDNADVTANEKFNVNDNNENDNENILDLSLKLDELQLPDVISANRSSRPHSAVSAVTDTNRPSVHDRERPTPFPTCYSSLLAGRATGISLSVSPGQNVQPVPTDDEGEVPSRSFLKRQAIAIVDTKSRRKGFRQQPKRK